MYLTPSTRMCSVSLLQHNCNRKRGTIVWIESNAHSSPRFESRISENVYHILNLFNCRGMSHTHSSPQLFSKNGLRLFALCWIFTIICNFPSGRSKNSCRCLYQGPIRSGMLVLVILSQFQTRKFRKEALSITIFKFSIPSRLCFV